MLACFADDSTGATCFRSLEKLANNDDGPGLTYTNDDVLLDGRRMLYVNSTCRLSPGNHKLLRDAIVRKMRLSADARRITCDCGDVICR